MSRQRDETVELVAKHTFGTWRFQKGWKKPPYIVDTEGVYFTEASSRKFLDF